MQLARARDDARVGRVDALDVRVDLAGVGAERGGDRRPPSRSVPPRPSVVTSYAVETPWKPATSTIFPSSSASWIRRARTSTIFALPWTVSVTMPACEPVSEIASWPRSKIAIAASAHEIRSPTETSMSSSRGCGPLRDLAREVEQLVGRVAHRGEDADDAVAALAGGDEPLARRSSASRCRRRTCRRTSSRPCRVAALAASASTAGTASNSVVVTRRV